MLLSEHIASLPNHIQSYFMNSGRFATWINELLEELSGKKILSEVRKEYGAIISDKVWIQKPLHLKQLNEIYSPLNYLKKYRVIDINSKLKLIDDYFEDEEERISVDTFTDSTVSSITVNSTGHDADSLKDYLFVITGGIYAGRTFVLNGNDTSDSSTTKINYLHSLPSALTAGSISSGVIVSPDYYVMIDCSVIYENIAANTDEVPISDDFERRIVPAWLRWKAEQSTSELSSETMYWQGEVKRIMYDINAETSPKPNKAKGRRLAGFER